MSRAFPLLGAVALSIGTLACTPAPLPPPVSQAEAVGQSEAASDAKTHAPQALLAAEKLLAEAKWLHDEGRDDEARAAGEEAIAAYSHAFALARAAIAEERATLAEKHQQEAAARLAELDRLKSKVAADADAFEMRARVHLDTEPVKDVDGMTPDRARARRQAALQLAAEARLLCIATALLDSRAQDLDKTNESLDKLRSELSLGSVKDDLYPRASEVRATCLKLLTEARRPAAKAAPQSADSDRLLTALTETGKLFAFRDDRGIVVNLAAPLTTEGTLTDEARSALSILGATAKAHPNFPLLVVVHTAKSGQATRADAMGKATSEELVASGAKAPRIESVESAQPLVSTRVSGADAKNERVEIVFVVPAR